MSKFYKKILFVLIFNVVFSCKNENSKKYVYEEGTVERVGTFNQDEQEVAEAVATEAHETSKPVDAVQVNGVNDTLVYPTSFISPKYGSVSFYKIDDVPNPKDGTANGFVSDPDNYITDEDEYELNKVLWRIEEQTTVQVAVVIVKSIEGEVPKTFAVKLFEKWKIGQADKDNGLLILTVVDQRRTEFEVGYGLESVLTDVVCHRIGTDEIVPYFKQGEFGKGLIQASNRVLEFVQNPEIIDEIYSQDINYYNESSNDTDYFPLFFLIGLYLFLTTILGFRHRDKVKIIDNSKEDYYDKYNDLKELDEKMYGCLWIIVFFLFPISAIYYFRLRKRKLKEYRYAPRFSHKNGKKLYLLNDIDEDAFLENAQVLEEKLKSVAYDVWATEDKSDYLVLQYEGSSRKYRKCQKCHYKTYGKTNTRILVSATYDREGEKEETYVCKNCNFTKTLVMTIPKKVRESSSSGSSYSGGSYSGSSSSSSSSWGGGSSGGGGAGVSW